MAKAKTKVGAKRAATRAANKAALDAQASPLLVRVDNDDGAAWHYEATEDALAVIRRMATHGHPRATIADAIGCSVDALDNMRKRQADVAEAFALGLGQLEYELVNILLEQARRGQFAPAMFLLRTRCAYRESGPPPGDQKQGPVIQINLPEPRDRAEYMRLVSSGQLVEPAPAIEHEPKEPVNRA